MRWKRKLMREVGMDDVEKEKEDEAEWRNGRVEKEEESIKPKKRSMELNDEEWIYV
jgi:hypothetical protein